MYTRVASGGHVGGAAGGLRPLGRGAGAGRWSDVFLFPPRRGGASHEQMCDLGIIHGNVVLTSTQQKKHDLHPLLGWKDNAHPSRT